MAQSPLSVKLFLSHFNLQCYLTKIILKFNNILLHTYSGWPPVLESTGNTGKYWKKKLVLENTGKTVLFHTLYWKVLDFLSLLPNFIFCVKFYFLHAHKLQIFRHLRSVNFKNFSNHGGQFKCISSHMREENLPPVELRKEDSGRVKRKKVMCSTRETKLTTYWGARSPLPTMDIRSIFVAEILFDGSKSPPPDPCCSISAPWQPCLALHATRKIIQIISCFITTANSCLVW